MSMPNGNNNEKIILNNKFNFLVRKYHVQHPPKQKQIIIINLLSIRSET